MTQKVPSDSSTTCAELSEVIGAYLELIDSELAKVRSGYANFDVKETPLEYVLIESVDEPDSIKQRGFVALTHEVTSDETSTTRAL